jgi:Zn-dependent peptidase ImmA (M78 family)
MIDRKKTEEKVKRILKENDMFKVPVDPIALAKKFSIDVKNAVFDDSTMSGMIAKRDRKAMILVNINDSPFRKRFTIAHELGHYFLHLDNGGEFVDNITDLFRGDFEIEEGDKKEIEANYFAAALLMNEELIRLKWPQYKDIDSMANLFKVSREAMSIRLKNLRLI